MKGLNSLWLCKIIHEIAIANRVKDIIIEIEDESLAGTGECGGTRYYAALLLKGG